MSRPATSFDAARREQIETWVRPLYVDLDGVDAFDAVGRRRALARRLLGQTAVDEEYLELLLLFHDTVKPLGSTAPGSRWWLFLRNLGIEETVLRRLAKGLEAWRESPRRPEEEALHDAELLERVGIAACARRLWLAGRKRVEFSRALASLDPGPVPALFRTDEARLRAEEGRRAVQEWLERLRQAAEDWR